jgi:DNA gyrase subunit B
MPYTLDDIHVIQWFEAIRRRPAMYIGDTSHLGLLYLAREMLDAPLEPTAIHLMLERTSLRIAASCTPPSLEPRTSGRPPFLVEACTLLEAPLDDPPTLAGVEFLDTSAKLATFRRLPKVPAGLAIANALSKAFSVSSVASGRCWSAAFSGGTVTSPLGSIASSDPDGLRIEFEPDPTIFGGASFQFHLLAQVAREIAVVRRTSVELQDRNSGCSYSTKADAG